MWRLVLLILAFLGEANVWMVPSPMNPPQPPIYPVLFFAFIGKSLTSSFFKGSVDYHSKFQVLQHH
jgi:hypothetical protein